MTGHRPWSEIRAKLHATPEGRAKAEQARRQMEDFLAISNLRETRERTLAESPDAVEASQPAEHRVALTEDILLSDLRSYIEGLGGRLEVTAIFPDQTIMIDSLPPEGSVSND